jgi:branched-subunit amino acid permease
VKAKAIYAGTTVSLLSVVILLALSANLSSAISKSPVLTNAMLVGVCIAAVGCAYFIPRAVGRLWKRRNK